MRQTGNSLITPEIGFSNHPLFLLFYPKNVDFVILMLFFSLFAQNAASLSESNPIEMSSHLKLHCNYN